VLLVQLAHRTFQNCQKAGAEYVGIAHEVRSLHSVLQILRNEAQRPHSRNFTSDPASSKALSLAIDGCSI